jgi:hypothetical protein
LEVAMFLDLLTALARLFVVLPFDGDEPPPKPRP